MIGVNAVLSQAAYSPVNDAAGRAYLLRPKQFRADGTVTGIVFCHGAGGSEADAWSGASTNLKRILGSIAQTRPVLAPAYTAGGDKWGNAAAVTQVNDAVTYLGAQGCRANKVILVTRSMGNLYAMNWARANLSKVAGIVSFEGVSDLLNIRNQAGFTASVDAAYAGGYSNATYGATYNPTVYAATHDLDGIPTRLYYATDDTTVPPATVTTLAGLIPTASAISMGTGGHADAPLANVDLPDLLTWIDNLAA